MATTQRQFGGQPIRGTAARITSALASTTGIKLTYTCPTGRQAKVTNVTVFPTAGAATIDIQTILNAQTVQLKNGTGQQEYAGGLMLDEAETCRINVTVLDAAGVFNSQISVEEFLAQ